MLDKKRKSHIRKALEIIGALFVLILVIGVLQGIYESIQREHRRRYYLPDTVRAYAACSASRMIYELNGREIHSLEELERSAYYPFRESYTPCCHGETLKLIVIETATTLTWRGIRIHQGEPQRVISAPADKVPPDIQTRRILTSYMKGVRDRIADIQKIRGTFVSTHQSALRAGECPLTFTQRLPPQSPLTRDLPTNERELQLYLRWLRNTEGVKELVDAWGHPLLFFLQDAYLVGRSRGSDGIFGSKDDIVVKVAVK